MQVYCEDRYVGDFNRKVDPSMNVIRLAFIKSPSRLFTEEGDPWDMAVSETFDLKIKRRTCGVALDGWSKTRDEDMIEQAVRRYNVPKDARHTFADAHGHGGKVMRWDWAALDVPLDVYEEHLFDHPEFEPV